MKTLRRLWKTSEPQYLTIDHELTFLGVTLQLTSEGILLHQRLYTEDLLQEHSPHCCSSKNYFRRNGALQKVAPVLLSRDLDLLKTKLRHLLQYLNSTKTLGLLYRFPKKREMTEFTVFADPSFAPSGKHLQSGFTIHLSFRNVRL